MRKKAWVTNLIFFFVAPPVLALAGFGVWVSLSAAAENFKIGQMSDQIIAVVSRARQMKINASLDPFRAQTDLMNHLVSFDNLPLSSLPDQKTGRREPERGVENPWGGLTRVWVYPSARALRLEATASSPVCRKLLERYAPDAVSLGLLRVDAREQLPSALWRVFYEQRSRAKPGEGMPSSAVFSACGGTAAVQLSLTFRLDGD